MAGERRQGERHVPVKAREAATAELVTLREPGQLTTGRVRTVAEELGCRNADHLAVGGRGREGPFAALVWFVRGSADEETSGSRRRDGRWCSDRRPDSRAGWPQADGFGRGSRPF